MKTVKCEKQREMGIFVVKWADSGDSRTGSSDDCQSEPSDSSSTQMGVCLNLAARHSNTRDRKTRKSHNKKAKIVNHLSGAKEVRARFTRTLPASKNYSKDLAEIELKHVKVRK